jgi:hypothetical protein
VGGGDPTGRYLIVRGYPSYQRAVLLWDHGAVIDLGVRAADLGATAVNSRGEVAMEADDNSTEFGYYWHDGVLTRLPGTQVTVRDINEGGVIVGSIQVGVQVDDPGLPVRRPVVWRSPTSQPELLGPDDLYGEAVGIDDDGTIIVERTHIGAHARDPVQLVRISPDGSLTDVPVPTEPGLTFDQFGGYDNGWGILTDTTTPLPHVYRLWHLGDNALRSLPGGAVVNAFGWLGVSLDPLPINAKGFSPVGTAFLLAPDGTRVDLPPLTGKYRGYALDVSYVSDDAHIVAGFATDPTYAGGNDEVAIVWRCS